METLQTLFVLAKASQGVKAERALRAAGVAAALIPVPRSLSAQCGVCLRVPSVDRARAEAILTETGTVVSAIHEIETGQNQPPRERTRNE